MLPPRTFLELSLRPADALVAFSLGFGELNFCPQRLAFPFLLKPDFVFPFIGSSERRSSEDGEANDESQHGSYWVWNGGGGRETSYTCSESSVIASGSQPLDFLM